MTQRLRRALCWVSKTQRGLVSGLAVEIARLVLVVWGSSVVGVCPAPRFAVALAGWSGGIRVPGRRCSMVVDHLAW